MTSLLEKVVGILAPHQCAICGNFNNVLCNDCLYSLATFEAPFCLFCGCPTVDWRACDKCPAVADYCFAACDYDCIAPVLRRFKFGYARAAAEPLVVLLDAVLPYFESDWIIVPVPTASQHIRRRGYDHAALLARSFARRRSLMYKPLLQRVLHVQQVGATRQQRLRQVESAFVARKHVEGKKILLLDDVCTTGATIRAASQALMKGGAVQVVAAVVAWKKPK